MTARQRLRYYGCSVLGAVVLGLLFYRSLPACMLLSLVSVPLEKVYKGFLRDKRKEKLAEGFRDVLYSVSGAVAAGRQMPFALELAAEAAAGSYGADSDIASEMDHICRSYREDHSDLGLLLESFGDRSHIPEIRQFASACRTCQLCGGDLEEVCRKSASLLLDKMSFQDETKSLISQKKIDVLLLTAMPAAVLLLLNLADYGYIAVLYETAFGRVVMTVCLLLMLCALLWGIKITRIEM